MPPIGVDATLRNRIKAWWNGEDLEPRHNPGLVLDPSDDVAASNEPEIPPPGPVRTWSEERIAAVQMVLGDGCHGPDIAGRTAELIAPAGLTSAQTVLEIGSGLALGARTIARQTGAWVDAIETNANLVAAGRKLGTDIEEDKKVTITSASLNEPEVMRHRRDLVLCRDALHRQHDPQETLKQIRALLKPTGQLFLTDFVLPENGNKKDLKDWVNLHDEPVNLLTAQQLRQALTVLGMDVHMTQDESQSYAQQTLQAIQAFAMRLEDEPVPQGWREWVMVEIEYWARIVTLLEQSKLQYVRITASVHK